MTGATTLKPAADMVKANDAHVLNESKAYRQARDALLAEGRDTEWYPKLDYAQTTQETR